MERTLRALAAPVRREILRIVWHEEQTAGKIAGRFEMTFGAVSQHLKVLRDAELVEVRREGRRRWYRAKRDALGPLAQALEMEWSGHLTRLKTLAEEEVANDRNGRD